MPQVIFKAATPDALPSMQQLQTWGQAWSKAVPYAVWGQPVIHGSVATMNVSSLGVEQISRIIQPGINTYNQTHRDKTITVVVEADN